MTKAAKIERTQKAFLKAMKEKFAEDPAAVQTAENGLPADPAGYKVIDCPICRGKGYHGPTRAFCHSCGSTGKKKVRT